MATALVTLTWCDQHLAEKDEEIPATTMPPWADGLSVDLCDECAAPVLAARALAEHYGSKTDRTPKPPKRVRAAARRNGASTAERPADWDGRATRSGKPALYGCPKCDGGFASRQSLAAHARNVHDLTLGELEGKATPHKCSEPGCGRAFTTPQGLALHERAHAHQQSAAS